MVVGVVELQKALSASERELTSSVVSIENLKNGMERIIIELPCEIYRAEQALSSPVQDYLYYVEFFGSWAKNISRFEYRFKARDARSELTFLKQMIPCII